jgi:hypothetical protein
MQERAQARRCGGRSQATGRGLRRLRGQDTGDHHGHNQLARPTLLGRAERLYAQAAHGTSDGGARARREAADHLKGVFGRHQASATEYTPPGGRLGWRPIRAMSQGPGFALPALAVALAQQDRRGGGAIGNSCDI